MDVHSTNGRAGLARTSNSRESRIIPTSHKLFLLDHGLQFTLAEKGIGKVDATEIPNIDFAHVERIQHPPVLWIPVSVLVRTQRMSDAF